MLLDKLKAAAAKTARSAAVPFALLALVLFAMHVNMSLGLNDDAMYATYLSKFETLGGFWKWSYVSWSSRLLIEGIILYIIHLPWLWRVLDTAMLVLAAFSIWRLADPQKKLGAASAWTVCGLVMLYPLYQLNSAGWVVTTLVYVWPLAAGLFSLLPLCKAARGEKPRWWEWALGLLCTAFAANMEQMAVALLVADAAVLIWCLVKKSKTFAFPATATTVVAGMIVFARTCPGVAERTINETNGWFPEFGAVPLWRKLEMGFSSTVRDFALTFNLSFLLFAILLLTAVCIRTKKPAIRAASAAPLAAALAFGLLGELNIKALYGLRAIADSIGQYGTAIRLSSIQSWIPDILFVGLVVCTAIGIWYAFERTEERLAALLTLGAGFDSRMVLGLSPTIWASGSRTYAFLYFAFYLCMALLLIRTILPSDYRRRNLVVGVFGAAAILHTANLIAMVM